MQLTKVKSRCISNKQINKKPQNNTIQNKKPSNFFSHFSKGLEGATFLIKLISWSATMIVQTLAWSEVKWFNVLG